MPDIARIRQVLLISLNSELLKVDTDLRGDTTWFLKTFVMEETGSPITVDRRDLNGRWTE